MMPTTIDQQLTDAWAAERDAMEVRLAPHFGRAELRDRVRTCLRGLLSSAERKNGWQLADVVLVQALIHRSPHRIIHRSGN